MEHPDTEVLIFISFHSSVFAVFVWLVVMFAGIPIQFNLCVLYAITSTFSGKLIFKLKHENYWYRFASVQRTKPQLIPLPLLSSDTSMFPAQTRREDTREVMIFFNKKNRFSYSLLRVPLIDLSWTAKKIPPFLNAVLMVKVHYKVWSRFR